LAAQAAVGKTLKTCSLEVGMRALGYMACFAVTAAIAAAASVSPRAQTSETQRNREVIRQHLDLMNRGKWRQAAEYFADDVQHHRGSWKDGTESIVRGNKALTDNLEDIFRTFPDWKMEIVEIASEGDSVIVRCRVSGTHRGVAARAVNGGLLVGVQPTGEHFQVQHIHWYKVRDGKITDHSTSRDDLGMLQQLGLVPVRQ
jgi:steroid delta-isomerase-like uncharacterized protein